LLLVFPVGCLWLVVFLVFGFVLVASDCLLDDCLLVVFVSFITFVSFVCSWGLGERVGKGVCLQFCRCSARAWLEASASGLASAVGVSETF
jgi:hypothetical protein